MKLEIEYSLTTGRITLATPFSHADFDPHDESDRKRLVRAIRANAELQAGFGRTGAREPAQAALAYDLAALARTKRFDETGRSCNLRLEDLED